MECICVSHSLHLQGMDGVYYRFRLGGSRAFPGSHKHTPVLKFTVKNKPYESILIPSSNFMQLPKFVCQILKATSISNTGKQIATDTDNYTPKHVPLYVEHLSWTEFKKPGLPILANRLPKGCRGS